MNSFIEIALNRTGLCQEFEFEVEYDCWSKNMARRIHVSFLGCLLIHLSSAYVITNSKLPCKSYAMLKPFALRSTIAKSKLGLLGMECRLSRRIALGSLATATVLAIRGRKAIAAEAAFETAAAPTEKLRNLNIEKLKEIVERDVLEGQFLVTGKLTRCHLFCIPEERFFPCVVEKCL